MGANPAMAPVGARRMGGEGIAALVSPDRDVLSLDTTRVGIALSVFLDDIVVDCFGGFG